MTRVVQVTAPSRLHFGLLSFGQPEGRQYGGVGAMIDRPGLELRLTSADEWSCAGPLGQRAHGFAAHWAAFHGLRLPLCRMEVVEAPPEHVGLGVGTQLGLSVAAGLNAFVGLPALTGPELAMSVGRGLRSAVGTYGFVMGGLVVEQGKLAQEAISPLDCRLDLPEEWRFLLLRPEGCAGLSGAEEAAAIDDLPRISPATTEQLIAEVRERLVPAAAVGDFAEFSASLFRYGHVAGNCFAARQGGPFNGPVLATLVETVQRLGVVGVGQSSWGPTIFALCENAAAAGSLRTEIERAWSHGSLHCTVSAPNNSGVKIDVFQHECPNLPDVHRVV